MEYVTEATWGPQSLCSIDYLVHYWEICWLQFYTIKNA